jgi:hypothetical protein
MTPPTFTAAELAKLGDTLDSLSALICTADEWCEPTTLGLLIEADDDAIRAAVKVVRRLARDVRFTRNSPAAYLPAPALAAVPEPVQS